MRVCRTRRSVRPSRMAPKGSAARNQLPRSSRRSWLSDQSRTHADHRPQPGRVTGAAQMTTGTPSAQSWTSTSIMGLPVAQAGAEGAGGVLRPVAAVGDDEAARARSRSNRQARPGGVTGCGHVPSLADDQPLAGLGPARITRFPVQALRVVRAGREAVGEQLADLDDHLAQGLAALVADARGQPIDEFLPALRWMRALMPRSPRIHTRRSSTERGR